MKLFLLSIFSLLAFNVFAQAPFVTYRMPSLAKFTAFQTKAGPAGFGAIGAPAQLKAFNDAVTDNDLKKSDFLDHINANVVSIQDGKKLFPTINGEVINYKLSIWTTTYTDGTKRPHNLPFSIITKVSGNYADSSAGPTNDATSFFGAPLTFRISPAFELTKESSTENKLFFGINTDLRLLTIGDTITNKLTSAWGAYGSAGLTYMGKGYAYEASDGDGEPVRYDGIWSFSAMLYYFKSGGTFNKAVFGDYEKKTMSGVELLLRFKTTKKENSKFNFLIGASNGFTRGAPNYAKWQFHIGVGK